MSSDFVLYSPDIETFDPNLEKLMRRIVEFWEKQVRESPEREGTGRATRGAHAKTLGVVRAEVEILANVPAPYAQGIYRKPGRHDAVIRFSSASNHLRPRTPTTCGTDSRWTPGPATVTARARPGSSRPSRRGT